MRSGLAKVLARAAIGPINLGVIGAALLGAVALASWPIAALGGAAYAAMVAADTANPAFRRRVLLGRERPGALPRPETITDPRLKAMVSEIGGARAEVDKIVAEVPDRVRRNLTSTVASVDELIGHAATLIDRLGELDAYLARSPLAEARAEADRLGKQAAGAADATAKREYELAATAAQDRVRAIGEIAASRERIHANLERVVATFKGVPAKLVRIRALDDQASDALSGDVGTELDHMNIDLKAFEQTLESMVPQAPARETETES